jgi:L-2-hydroxyglutarate oxidase LhgO
MDEVGITIIGAGVVGLAVAAELSKDFENIVVLEKHEKFGQETSSRNSEVIHAGIYYPHGSLKAELCVEGAELLYRYCEARGIPHDRIGKLIVAVDDAESGSLEEIYKRGLANAARELRLIDSHEVRRLEPAVNATRAVHSPHTGIIDSHALMAGLHHEAKAAGVMFSFGSEVTVIEHTARGFVIGIAGEDYRFLSRIVINSAGLGSDHIAALMGIDIDDAGYRLRPCKGSYFSYQKRSPVKMLVYPVPHHDLAGLGVHATLDLGGRLRFGPDTEYVDHLDYTVDTKKADAFYEGARKIIQGLDRDAFVPDMAGIRPKLAGEGVRDFVIAHEAARGLEGAINLVGIESPGLTACLAIARIVARIVGEVSA